MEERQQEITKKIKQEALKGRSGALITINNNIESK